MPTTPRLFRLLFFWPVLALVAVLGIWVLSRLPVSPGPPLPTHAVTIGERSFVVELARSQDEVRHGLMGRTHLAPDRGMLFAYSVDAPRRFWMKNTLIPLDILFFAPDPTTGELILESWAAAVPCVADPCPTYSSHGVVRYVVELPAGTVTSAGWSPGVRLDMAPLPPPGS